MRSHKVKKRKPDYIKMFIYFFKNTHTHKVTRHRNSSVIFSEVTNFPNVQKAIA